MITGLFEVAIAFKDFDAAVNKYSDVLDMKPMLMKKEDIPFPDLKVALFIIGNVVLSLIGSETADTPLAKHVGSKGEGVYAIGIEVSDIEQKMKDLRRKGVELVFDEPIAYVAGKQNLSFPKSMHGVQICWAQHNPDWDNTKTPAKLWASSNLCHNRRRNTSC